MAKADIKGWAFSELLKAAKTQNEQQEQAEYGAPQILGDDVPLLSPALGFQRDVALVLVDVEAKTRANLAKVGEAFDRVRLVASALERGEQDGHEHRDDADDDEQLDQRERVAT